MAITLPLGEKARADARGRSNSWSTWQSGMETALTLQEKRNSNLDRVTKREISLKSIQTKCIALTTLCSCCGVGGDICVGSN